jgi:hypothetical protein
VPDDFYRLVRMLSFSKRSPALPVRHRMLGTGGRHRVHIVVLSIGMHEYAWGLARVSVHKKGILNL